MAKAGFYAVARGRVPGVYNTWHECSQNVSGYSSAKYKKFATLDQAEDFIEKWKEVADVQYESYSDPEESYFGGDYDYRASPLGVQRIYTDGSARGNARFPQKGGFGVYFGPNHEKNVAKPLCDVERPGVRHTNQRAELRAMEWALKTISLDSSRFSYSFEIITDSMYTINCLEVWSRKWVANGWTSSTGTEVCNRDVIESALDLLWSLRQSGVSIELLHVKGHGDCFGNNEADRLANLGADNDYY